MLHAALCDDRPEDLAALGELVEGYRLARPGLELEAHPYRSASGVLDAGIDFDLFLLDVLMPGLNGIELGMELRGRCPAAPILYLTVSRDFALESYRAEAMSYLLKPLSRQAVFHALDQAVERCRAECAAAVPVAVEGGVRSIPFRSILCVEARGRTLSYRLLDGVVDASARRPTFAKLWAALEPEGRFLLVRRGCFVNMDYIQFLGEAEVELTGGRLIPMARDRRGPARRGYYAYCRRRFGTEEAARG